MARHRSSRLGCNEFAIGARQLRFMLAGASGGNRSLEAALMDNDEPMIVEPAPARDKRTLRIVGARGSSSHITRTRQRR